MSGVQHFDQAVFKLEALMQQTTQLLELLGNALAGIAQVVERQQLFRDDVDARVNRIGQFQPALVTKRLGLTGELLIDLEMTGRHVVDQDTTELLQRLSVFA
ncbi:hypothetical protein D3C81_2118000 [compost metagenome]